MATEASLSGDVLRDVSRSFYLSLRILPSGFREPMAIGYLLARLSDTIADAGTLPQADRVALLDQFAELVKRLPELDGVRAHADALGERTGDAGLPEGEQVLVGRTADVFAAASGLSSELVGAVRKVVGIIVGGQRWDLTRFAGDGCVCLESDKELEQYTYDVAGCVGEFWTEVAFVVRSDAAREPRDQMMAWGRNYGKGLQLVNILRDVPEDLEKGRCYLPGVDADDREALMVTAAAWRAQAREWLRDGLRHAEALRGTRMRFASGLPALLGLQTLDLLDEAGWEEWQRGVKVTRRDVKRSMAVALGKSAWFLPGRWSVG